MTVAERTTEQTSVAQQTSVVDELRQLLPPERVLWRDYDRFMQKNVKKIGDERLTKVPADLDLKPYRDEHDFELLQRMVDCIEKGKVPPGIDAARIKRALERHQPELRERLQEMARSKR